MGYRVEWDSLYLLCRSASDAETAARIVNENEDVTCYLRVQIHGEELWAILRQGDHWHDDEMEKLWAALAPHLTAESTVELRGEDGERWRIRWDGKGGWHEEHEECTIWQVSYDKMEPRTFWSGEYGNQNVSVYGPGERCEAFPGRPVFPDVWVCVYWWPGTAERITVHASQADAEREAIQIGVSRVPLEKTAPLCEVCNQRPVVRVAVTGGTEVGVCEVCAGEHG